MSRCSRLYPADETRKHHCRPDFPHHLDIANGFLVELETQLEIIERGKYQTTSALVLSNVSSLC
jgi:hypothetical protein